MDTLFTGEVPTEIVEQCVQLWVPEDAKVKKVRFKVLNIPSQPLSGRLAYGCGKLALAYLFLSYESNGCVDDILGAKFDVGKIAAGLIQLFSTAILPAQFPYNTRLAKLPQKKFLFQKVFNVSKVRDSQRLRYLARKECKFVDTTQESEIDVTED
eukprot:g64575.t1